MSEKIAEITIEIGKPTHIGQLFILYHQVWKNDGRPKTCAAKYRSLTNSRVLCIRDDLVITSDIPNTISEQNIIVLIKTISCNNYLNLLDQNTTNHIYSFEEFPDRKEFYQSFSLIKRQGNPFPCGRGGIAAFSFLLDRARQEALCSPIGD